MVASRRADWEAGKQRERDTNRLVSGIGASVFCFGFGGTGEAGKKEVDQLRQYWKNCALKWRQAAELVTKRSCTNRVPLE